MAVTMTNVEPPPVSAPFAGYRALTPETVREHLAGVPAAVAVLGGGGRPADWRAREVGDGNLNLVFIVEGPGGSVVAKQALPYVRLVGESWPLPLERSFFEHAALTAQARHVGRLVPAVLHFDRGMALIVLERLHPHVISTERDVNAGVPLPPAGVGRGGVPRADVCSTPPTCHLPADGEKTSGGVLQREHRPLQDHRGPGFHPPLPHRRG